MFSQQPYKNIQYKIYRLTALKIKLRIHVLIKISLFFFISQTKHML